MFFHASGLGDGPPDVSQSKALLEFMGTHLQSQNKPFSQYLQTEIERFTSETDATYLAHDYLEQNNKPIYFREFVARARDVGLDYLGESEFFTMLGTDITDEAKIRLSTEIQDIVVHKGMHYTVSSRLIEGQSLDVSKGSIRPNLCPVKPRIRFRGFAQT